MDRQAARIGVRSAHAAAIAAAVVLGLVIVVALRAPAVARSFDPTHPADELHLCRVYGRSAVHASPLMSAPVVEPRSSAFEAIEQGTIGGSDCPFVFEVHVAPGRYVQYTGRGGP